MKIFKGIYADVYSYLSGKNLFAEGDKNPFYQVKTRRTFIGSKMEWLYVGMELTDDLFQKNSWQSYNNRLIELPAK